MHLRCQPARDLPIAWAPSFFGASGMLMDANDRTVNEDFLKIGITGQLGKNPLPNATFLPACEPPVDDVPGTELFWQFAPARSRTCHPQRSLDKQAIVRRATPAVFRFSWQQVGNPLPLIVTQALTGHKYPLSVGWAHYIMLKVNTGLGVLLQLFLNRHSALTILSPEPSDRNVRRSLGRGFGGLPAVAALSSKLVAPLEPRIPSMHTDETRPHRLPLGFFLPPRPQAKLLTNRRLKES